MTFSFTFSHLFPFRCMTRRNRIAVLDIKIYQRKSVSLEGRFERGGA
jgi:hypothetical protein